MAESSITTLWPWKSGNKDNGKAAKPKPERLDSDRMYSRQVGQKIVIILNLDCDKCRSKAMKIAAVADGVISVAWEGDEKNKVVITGDGTDAATVTRLLRKKLGYADLLSVEQVK